jgi:DNA repair exonuclease SbcCD ATPase subunit
MKRVRAGLETRIKELELGREEWIKSNERKTRAIDELEADVERLQSLGPIIVDREAAIKAFEKENAKLRLQEKQNQAEICAACRKAAEDSANGVPLPPDPDEDRIRELQDKRREDQERRHDADRQHAAEGG